MSDPALFVVPSENGKRSPGAEVQPTNALLGRKAQNATIWIENIKRDETRQHALLKKRNRLRPKPARCL